MGEEAAQQQSPPSATAAAAAASSWPKEVRVDVIDHGGGASSASNSKPSSSSFRLWRVPKHVRDINKEAYGPKFVCIGPYHRRRRRRGGGDRDADDDDEEERRLRVEKLKERYLDKLLTDVVGLPHVDDQAKRDEILLLCTCRLGEMLDSVRRFYAEEEYLRGMTDEEMVRMLLLDGCFIIKHLYNFVLGYEEEELYATRWSPAQLRIDLGLLENQIPFFVLEEIFYHLTPRKLQRKITRDVGDDGMMTMRMRLRKRHKLLVMAMWYMLKGWFVLPEDESNELYKLIADKEVHHLLHLLHLAHLVKVDAAPKSPPCEWQLWWQWPCDALQLLLCILPLFLVSLPLHMCRCCGGFGGEEPDPKANIASASQLRGLGVKIRMVKRDRRGILDVRLRKSLGIGLIPPELEVPALPVEEATAVLLQNLVAYEQQMPRTPARQGEDQQTQRDLKSKDYFTTYAFLMYNLVSSTEDIAELQEKGVLLNNFGSHETIINYFKNLCRWNQRSKEETPIGKVLDELRECSQYHLYRHWAEAKKYMDSPVKILALIVSTLLAISTVLQTTVAFYPK